ncbi:MAG: FHA domain-containing protein [Planctomycetaceae bacterium]|nr:FHA domain-containing protein [Planctomycetaceae bacterium]
MSRATLLVIQGQDQGARFQVGDDPIGIGRGVRNEIRLLDTEVSRQHAHVLRDGGRCVLLDRGSSNGTFLNGRPIKSAPLVDGDRIQIGRSVILFSDSRGDESKYAASVIDLVGREEAGDSSRIVGRVSHETSSAAGPSTLFVRPADTSVLYRIAEEAVSPSSSVEQLLVRVLDLTIAAVSANRGCVLLREIESDELTPVAARHRQSGGSEKMPVSRSIVDYVLRSGHGVRTSDARRDARFDAGQSILQAGVREALCVPMQGRYETIGVIYVDTTTAADAWLAGGGKTEVFSDEHLRLLIAIGRQAALAVENNRYQQALVKAERLAAMGQTIALLSHHIKNILQGVRGGSYLIDMGLGGHNEEMIRKGWNIVEKNQGKIYHLVMDMLTFSKDRRPTLEAGSVNQTIGDVCELMQARAEECGVRLDCRFDPHLTDAVFDEEGIHRAALNVVINAIDAVEGTDGGLVSVETGRIADGDLVFIAVSDNGPGIPADKLASIFNIFESTKGLRGTGLGLAVSRKILREHGGEISVESQPGGGSRFLLSWPRHPDEEHRAFDNKTSY